jgi:hypothetical protein
MFQESPVHCGSEERYAGVRALWLKVIIRAIFDWVSWRDSKKPEHRKVAEQAHLWLFRPGKTVFNSLEGICEFLDISPAMVRSTALTMSKEQVIKVEHLERDSNAYSAQDISLEIYRLLTGEEE